MNPKHLYIDLDKTLIPYDSFPRFLPSLLAHLGPAGWLMSLPIGFWAISGQRPKVRPAMAKLLKGKDYKNIDAFSKKWMEKNILKDIRKNLLPPFSFSLASMSMDLIVEPLGLILGGDHSLGTQLGRKDGRYTGELSSPQCGGQGKADMIAEDAKIRGFALSEIGLLTDHHRDIPALEIVGFPFLVNPTKELIAWNVIKKAPIFLPHEKPKW